ncbi:putative disease resistance protein RGA3 [Castanea sativa]|uniref:putative disease resistance protein RGA3 n=1 Tax=Castanea sativa TaxID=21020 RepID=UPI003F64D1B2
MAEQVLSVVVDGVIANAMSLASEHISSVWGFKEEIGKLQVSLTKIQALLHDAEKKQLHDESVKIWLRQLKDVAYEADDVLDEYDYEILRQKVETQNQVRSFFSSSNPVVFPVKMAKRIKTINQSLDEIKKDIPLLGLIASLNPIPQTDLDRETDSFIDGSEVVGRRDDVLKIVNLLIGANNQQVISVIPIVGMAGLGKTTIAKLVYNDKLVKKHFDEKIWVCVSENFDVKRILREILEALDHNCSGLENKNAILQHLQKKLQRKRYLLILDDVWDDDREKWDSLRSSLLGINQNNGNNILVTTRKDNVAQIMKTSLIHQLEKLSEDECWLIFKEKAFANERIPVTPDLEDIGRKIAKRCGGNPLAARVLGGMMRLKKDKSEWLLIQNSKTWDSMEDNNGVFQILKLSFDHLPTPSLKQCFAYCSIFPKDFIIEKKLLVQLWMAEGFLQTSERSFSVIEDIGNKYFDFLVGNSLFQDLERDSYGDIRSCKMHDLVHNLALSISKGETLHLEGNLGDGIDVSHTRRLSLISDGHTTPTIPLSEDGMGRLRTVFLDWVDLGDKLLEFKCVRSLLLSGSCIKELPESIGMLRHLRLLHIEDTNIKVIPISVSMLYNLQTLVIKDCHLLKELPKDLQNLINLRHIEIDHFFIKQLPINMGKLTCLQTLPFFAIGQDVGYRIEELGCLSQLKEELCIYNLEHVRDKEEAKTANLAVKSKVHKLGFYWSLYRGEDNNNDEDILEGLQPHPNLKSLEIENFEGERFPSWLLGSDNIRGGWLLFDNLLEICLSNCGKCEKLPTLGHLPSLKVLEINRMYNVRCIGTEFYSSFNGEGSSNSRGGSGSTVLFPALEELVLCGMHNLVEWNDVTEPTAELGMIFPRLEYLEFQECMNLTSAPHHFPFLKELKIYKIRGLAFENIISELTTLTSLKIEEVSELACLPEHFLQKNRSLVDLTIRICADLESILPHEHLWPTCTSLRSLSIYGCDKLGTLPNGLHNLHCLEKFEVYCPNLRSFPSIQGITSFLQNLQISCSDEVLPIGLQSCMSLQNLFICNCPHLISIPDLRNLHSLTYLQIDSCPNLKSIPDLKELPSLTRLDICNCSDLISIPDLKELPSLTLLDICNCSDLISIPDLKELPSLTLLDICNCSNLISIPDLKELPSLTELKISGCSNLISISDIRELHSLTHLGISKCQKLRCVPDGLDCLTRLECLWIGDICKELNSFPSLNSILHSHAPLQSLHLYGWDSLNSLPEEIKYFTALQILEISEFGEMISLPDWLGDLSSLQKLCIYKCKNMMYLPTTQAMRRLIKLEELEIYECPKLEERCDEWRGVDAVEWPKIAHIPIFSPGSWTNHYDF